MIGGRNDLPVVGIFWDLLSNDVSHFFESLGGHSRCSGPNHHKIGFHETFDHIHAVVANIVGLVIGGEDWIWELLVWNLWHGLLTSLRVVGWAVHLSTDSTVAEPVVGAKPEVEVIVGVEGHILVGAGGSHSEWEAGVLLDLVPFADVFRFIESGDIFDGWAETH